jgi:AraC family transcriptional regulator, ethanolamine operon transcriptional activator
MATVDYAHFDEFQDALRGVKERYVLRMRQERAWRLTSTTLHDIGLMAGREGAANMCCGAAATRTYNLLVSLGGDDTFTLDGHRFEAGTAGWMTPGRVYYRETTRPSSWLRITISSDALLSGLASHEGEVDTGLLKQNAVTVAGHPVAELVRLARRVFEIDAAGRSCDRTPESERALRREVLDAVFRVVLPRVDSAPLRRHVPHGARVLDRALALIAGRDGAPIHTEDLCRATGVSERTLRNVFYRNFGIGPHQYLMAVRLHDVRSAILNAADGEKVSSICADFGIWDFGRFAGHYRKLFGVLPSQELGARPGPPGHRRLARKANRRSSVALGYSPKSA